MSLPKAVHQYNLKGEYIRSFSSNTAAADFFEKDESVIRKVKDKYPQRSACGYYWASEKLTQLSFDEEEQDIEEGEQKGFPNILIFDIETAPLRAYVWRRYKQNIYTEQLISEWFMISWAAKWLYSPDIISDRINSTEILEEDDKRIATSLWEMIDRADIVVAHNGNRFDIPKIRNRFLINGLRPPSPFKAVDTKIIAKTLGFSSNKLEDINRTIGLDRKLDTDFTLWSRCMEGEEKALIEMETYNKQDIEMLEQTYINLRPWMGPYHPNVGLYMETEKPVCYVCGSTKLNPNGYYYTAVGQYQAYQCLECGAPNRGRFTQVPKEKRKGLVRSIAKH
jgi:uncharacterized protein YprB with RNaseH-like and TPR domain